MGKIVIVEEKADKLVDKLETMKDCLDEVLDCFTEAMEGHRYSEDDDEWDDEYEVKRRRGSRGIYPHGMRRGMRRGMRGGDSEGSSRY